MCLLEHVMQSLVHSALHIWYLSLYFILTATVKIVSVSFLNFFIIIFFPPIVVFLFFFFSRTL